MHAMGRLCHYYTFYIVQGNSILQRCDEGIGIHKRMRLMPNLADFSSRREEWKRTLLVVLVGYTSPGSCTKHMAIYNYYSEFKETATRKKITKSILFNLLTEEKYLGMNTQQPPFRIQRSIDK
jgi:hypothetical protein